MTKKETKAEKAIDEAIDKVPNTDEVFKDKPENTEEVSDEVKAVSEVLGGAAKKADIADEAFVGKLNNEKPLPETEEQREETIESKTVEEEVKEEAEPLYQKKVYIVDLNNIGIEIEGEGELIVDVLEVKKNKVIIRNGELTIEVPKDFLF